MGAQSRPKGQRGELAVAKLLQEWWQQLEPNATFQRSPGSGGFATSRKLSADFNLHGDIVTDAKRFPFCVEVKNREEWKPEDLTRDNPKSAVWDWWLQCQRDAKAANKIPLLIFKKNHVPWNVWFPDSTYIRDPSVYNGDSHKIMTTIDVMTRIESKNKIKPFTAYQMLYVNPGVIPAWTLLSTILENFTPEVFSTATVNPG